MEVILLERVEKLGLMGDVVTVKPGYARNFLLPQKKALRATTENRQEFESRRADLEANNIARREEAEAVAAKMDGTSVVILRQASEGAHLYGSVTNGDLSAALTDAGFKTDKNQIGRDKPIKTVGLHEIRIKLHPEVAITIVANVARSDEEAGMQARGELVGAEREAADDARDIEEEELLDADAFFEDGAIPDEDAVHSESDIENVDELTDSSASEDVIAEGASDDDTPDRDTTKA